MTIDALELQLASALQRYNVLERRAGTAKNPMSLLQRSLAELSTALEELRAAQEQLVENQERMAELQEKLRLQNERYWQLFDEVPQPYVVTREDSTIVEVNKAASELFNVSQRFLVGKTLSVFVCEDRAGFLTQLSQLVAGRAGADIELKLRPRERAPLTVTAHVKANEAGVRWLLRETDPVTS